jgi:NAD(P)-dependent dehydrogenase (short-subunit alcohol dehydrogenase family)
VFALAQAMEHIGRMARTAADAAALLVAIAGPDPNDPTAHITLYYPISCPTWALGRQAFDRMVDVKLKKARLCIREELWQMVKQEGGVIASIPGLVGLRTSSIYVAAKHGVSGLTKPAAIE